MLEANEDAVAKVAPGGTVNAAGTDRVRAAAAGYASPGLAGTGLAATGIRPDPGPLPPADEPFQFDPLRFAVTPGANLTYTPRTGYGTPFATLRALASTSPEIFSCIQCRKDQMTAIDFDFAPRDPKAKGPAWDAKVKRAREFFAKPDRVTPFKTWIQTGVDEVLTIDALSIYKRRTRGGQVYGYEIKDGATFKVLVDAGGMTPLPPQKAYRQILLGAPSTDWTTDELLYLPKNVRTWSPYGMSPTEALLLIVTGALNRQMFNLAYYAEGNVPEALAGVPDTWSPKQIAAFNEYWNLLMRGDPANRSRLRFVPQAMAKSVHEFRKTDFSTQWELWLLKMMCACYGVTPSEIGFTDDVNKATAKAQGDVNQRRGIKPMANFWKGVFDSMLATDLDLADLETTWSGGEGEDAVGTARIEDFQIRNGSKSVDEIRVAHGDDPIGVPPCIVTATGPVPWASVLDPAAEPAVPLVSADFDPAQPIALDAELKKYRAVALKAVKAGRPVPVFRSTVIPAPLQARLSRALTTVASLEDVHAAFRVEKQQPLTAARRKAEAQMKGELTRTFAQMGRAMASHVKAGLDAHGGAA